MDDNQTQECTEKDEPSEESIAKKSKCRQYLAAFTVTILAISNGMAAAWSSPVQGILESKNNPIGNEPMSDSVFTWITSVLYIGSLIGIFIWNRTADILGRKKNGYLLSLTHIIGWIGISLASNPTHLIVSRVIMGLGCCGIISNSQLYISEVVDDDIKRPLCSLILIGMNAGMVLVCLLGWFLPYHILNLICFCPAVIFVVLYFWLPETPLYLLMKKREREAELSMKWYGLEKIEVDDVAKDNNKEQASFTELFATCRMAKITSVTLFLIVGQQMSGIGPLMAYSVNVFKLTGSSISPYLSSVIVVLLQFVISCVSGIIVKSIPRKPLLLYSYVGAFLSYMMVFAYFFLKDSSNAHGLKYLPIIGVMCFIVAYNLGIGSLPFVVFPEIFPPRLLNHGVSLSLVVLVGGTFTFTKIFSSLKELLGESGLFLFFSCSNLFFALFVLYFVGERKNHSKDEVEGSPATRRALLRF